MNSRRTPFRLIGLTTGDLQGPFGRALNPRFVGSLSSLPLSIGGTQRFSVIVIRDILNARGPGLLRCLFGTYLSKKMKILEYARRARPGVPLGEATTARTNVVHATSSHRFDYD